MGDPTLNHVDDRPNDIFGAGDYLFLSMGNQDWVSGGGYRKLNLLTGDWWENPEWGNGVLELLRESRLTETDRQILANYLSDYIRKTPGVMDVREVKCSFEGGQFRYECTVETGAGTARISYG